MASKRIDITVNGKDNTKSALNSVSNNVKKLESDVKSTGSKLTMSSGFNKIVSQSKTAVSKIKAAFSGLGGALASLTAGFSLSTMITDAAAIEAKWTVIAANTGTATSQLSGYKSQLYEISQKWGTDNADAGAALQVVAQKYGNINTAMAQMNGLAATSILTGQSQVDIAQALYKAEMGNMRTLKNTVLTLDQYNRYAADGVLTQEEIGQIMAENEIRAQGYTDTAAAGINRMNNAMKKLYAGFVVTLVPAIELIANGLSAVAEIFQGLPSPLKTVVTYLTAAGLAVATIGAPLAIAAPLLSTMASGAGKLVSGIKAATTAMWGYATAAKAADKADDGVGTGGGTAGTASKIGSTLSTAITTGMSAIGINAMAGGTWAATASSIAMGLATGIAQAFVSVGGAIIAPAIYGLFEDGSLLSGNFDLAANWAPQWEQIKTDIGGIGAYAGKTWNDMRTLAQGAFSGIMSAWNGLKSLISQGATGIVSVFGPTIGSIRSAVSSLWGLVRQGAQGVVSIISSGISAVRSAVSSLYSMVRAGASGVVSIVQSIVGGPGGPRGPSGMFSNINFKYENYGGWQKNAWTGENSMSGNCADMTAGLISRYGGSYVSGTWNGNPHVWWRSPTGQEFDPARYALNGTGSPPPRGPSVGASGTNIIITGDVYGFDDFAAKVAQATGSVTKSIRRM